VYSKEFVLFEYILTMYGYPPALRREVVTCHIQDAVERTELQAVTRRKLEFVTGSLPLQPFEPTVYRPLQTRPQRLALVCGSPPQPIQQLPWQKADKSMCAGSGVALSCTNKACVISADTDACELTCGGSCKCCEQLQRVEVVQAAKMQRFANRIQVCRHTYTHV